MPKHIVFSLLFLISFSISVSQGSNQINKVEGIYLGRVEGGYSFCCKTAPGIEEMVVFDEILSVILEKYPLHMDEHVGENFMISFVENVMVRDSGSEGISTVIRLQKLLPGQHRQE